MIAGVILLIAAPFGLSAFEPAAPAVTALTIAPDGKAVVVGSQRGIDVRDPSTLAPRRRLDVDLHHVNDLEFSPDGKLLAVAGGKPAVRGRVEVLAWPSGKIVYRKDVGDDLVQDVAFSSDSRFWASAGYDRSVRVHEAASGKLVCNLTGHSKAVLAVAFLGDGKTLVSAGVDQSLRVWNVRTDTPPVRGSGTLVRTLENHTGPVVGLARRPSVDSDAPAMVASIGSDRTLRLWQPDIGRLVRFARLTSAPLAVAWTRDGRHALTSCKDGKVRVVDASNVQVVATLDGLDEWAYALAIVSTEAGSDVLVGGKGGKLVRSRTPFGHGGGIPLKGATREP